MPSSGYGIIDLIRTDNPDEHYAKVTRLNERAEHAMSLGMFCEWLESFVAAWEKTKDVDIASYAGLEEWDM